MDNFYENALGERYHNLSIDIAAQWARGSITTDRLFPQPFTNPERMMQRFKAGDPEDRLEYDPQERYKRQRREQVRGGLEDAFSITQGETMNQFHQNLESGIGQALKEWMSLPYESNSRVDVLKAAQQGAHRPPPVRPQGLLISAGRAMEKGKVPRPPAPPQKLGAKIRTTVSFEDAPYDHHQIDQMFSQHLRTG